MRPLPLIYYSFAFFHCLAPITLFYGLMMTVHQRSGVEIGCILSIGSLTGFLLEIPGGALADRYGIRRVLIVSQFLRCLAFTLLLYWQSFLSFCVVFMLLATKESLVSGSSDAYLVFFRKENSNTLTLSQLIGIDTMVRRLALIISSLIGALLLKSGWTALLLCSLASASLGMLSAACLSMYDQESRIDTRPSVFQSVLLSTREIGKNEMLRWHLLTGSLLGGLIACLWPYWALIGTTLNLSPWHLALFLLSINLSGLLAGFLHVRSLCLTPERILMVLPWPALGLIIGAYIYNSISFLIFFASMACYYYIEIGLRTESHRFMKDEFRSTLASFEGWLFYGIEIPASLLFGFCIDGYELSKAIEFLGLTILSISLLARSFYPGRLKHSSTYESPC